MTELNMVFYKELFAARIDTLAHIVDVSSKHFQAEGDGILDYRVIDDMLPFGTQIVYTCNQVCNFVLWCEGRDASNMSAHVESLAQVKAIMEETKTKIKTVKVDDAILQSERRIDIGENRYLELSGVEYINDFLIPNVYFHMVTAYNIMRMKGAPLGKVDYMTHLLPKVKQG